jgi:hypothetical protein
MKQRCWTVMRRAEQSTRQLSSDTHVQTALHGEVAFSIGTADDFRLQPCTAHRLRPSVSSLCRVWSRRRHKAPYQRLLRKHVERNVAYFGVCAARQQPQICLLHAARQLRPGSVRAMQRIGRMCYGNFGVRQNPDLMWHSPQLEA